MNATVMKMELDLRLEQATEFFNKHEKPLMALMLLVVLAMFAGLAFAATSTDTWAKDSYDFFLAAASGYLVRGICIVGGIIGLLTAAGSGRYLLAAGGVVLAIFGMLGPKLVNAVFGTALI